MGEGITIFREPTVISNITFNQQGPNRYTEFFVVRRKPSVFVSGDFGNVQIALLHNAVASLVDIISRKRYPPKVLHIIVKTIPIDMVHYIFTDVVRLSKPTESHEAV